MTDIKLGTTPDDLEVELARGADFVATLRNIDPATADDPTPTPVNWPAGSVVELQLGNAPTLTTWTATINGADATFNVPAATVTTFLDTGQRDARLYHRRTGVPPVCWATGRVDAN